jgi:hypothetical protein
MQLFRQKQTGGVETPLLPKLTVHEKTILLELCTLINSARFALLASRGFGINCWFFIGASAQRRRVLSIAMVF